MAMGFVHKGPCKLTIVAPKLFVVNNGIEQGIQGKLNNKKVFISAFGSVLENGMKNDHCCYNIHLWYHFRTYLVNIPIKGDVNYDNLKNRIFNKLLTLNNFNIITPLVNLQKSKATLEFEPFLSSPKTHLSKVFPMDATCIIHNDELLYSLANHLFIFTNNT